MNLTPQIITQKIFFPFVGMHSLLMGIFPFFIPVLLWKSGFNIADISFFISISGLGFLLGIRFYEFLTVNKKLVLIFFFSFALQIFLLLFWKIFLPQENFIFLSLLGFFYGLYNAIFWLTQRSIFLLKSHSKNTGKNFGNFQILVSTFLQIGILIGGFLSEHYSFETIFLTSLLINLIGIFILFISQKKYLKSLDIRRKKVLSLKEIISSKFWKKNIFIFLLDGPFLFLESFFWSISLFLLVQENLFHLGLLIVGLAVTLSLIFYVLKNIIDHINHQKIFLYSVLFYALSWFLRVVFPFIETKIFMGIFLILITFSTLFFRLHFNKIFFDKALHTKDEKAFILGKSYLSQFSIFIFFGMLCILLNFLEIQNFMNMNLIFSSIYMIMGILSLGYLKYKK